MPICENVLYFVLSWQLLGKTRALEAEPHRIDKPTKNFQSSGQVSPHIRISIAGVTSLLSLPCIS
jgi:hypothetical protein